MKAILVVATKQNVNVRKFETITEAYHFYLNQYSTFGEWFYYLRVAHTWLSKVDNEEIMECIFRNVFNKNVCLVLDNEC